MSPELTLHEVVTAHNLNPHYTHVLRRAIVTGQLPGRQYGKTWVVSQSDVDLWLINRPKPGRPRRVAESAKVSTASAAPIL